MKKVLVFQHVAHKILGTLNPTLKAHGLRMRYINFERTPEIEPTLEKYHGLIVLGGYMGVYESHIYKHIKTELLLIEEALKKDIPVLGICLGSQLLAHVLGSGVRKCDEKEVGWYDIHFTPEGRNDPLFNHCRPTEKLFQLHGDTFDVPQSAIHLASSSQCSSQSFRYGDKAYGIQFHMEVDSAMIHRWLNHHRNQAVIRDSNGKFDAEIIKQETERYIAHSMQLSQQTFTKFIELFAQRPRPLLLGTDHARPLEKKRKKDQIFTLN